MRKISDQITRRLRGRAAQVVVVVGALAVVGVGVPVGVIAAASASTPAPSQNLFTPQPASATVSTDAKSVELGVNFVPAVSGQILGVEFLKSTHNIGTHTGSLWSATGTLMATATFSKESASGWQTVLFASPVNVSAGAIYTAGYHATAGHYDSTTGYFAAPHTSGNLGTHTAAGRKSYSTQTVMPTVDGGNNSNYWVDVIFTATPVVAPSPTATPSSPAPSPTPTTSVTPSPTPSSTPTTSVTPSPSPTATVSTPAPTPTPTITPTITPTPTATPSSGTNFNYVADSVGLKANIATKPNVWPNASNTGVPAGTTLKASGALVVTTAGTVLSGLNISGCVDIQANNVTIKNSLITCGRSSVAIRVAHGFSGFLLQDSEINGGGNAAGCIGFGDFTLLRDNLHDCVDGVDGGGNAVVEYSYVHDLTRLTGTHNDTFQTVGGDHNLLVGNTFQAYRASTSDFMNSSIQTGHLSSNLTDTLVEYNYMDGGNYTVNAGATSTNGYTIAGYVFVGNQFGHDSRYGPVSELGTGITFDSSNVWAGTTTAVH